MSKENVYVSTQDGGRLHVSSPSIRQTYTNPKKFVDDIPRIFKNVKSVTFNVFDYLPADGFTSNMEFCKAVKEKLDSLQIGHNFCFAHNMAAAMFLFWTNINFEFGDSVLQVVAFKKNVNVAEYEYTQNGWKSLRDVEMEINPKEDSKLIREKILASSNPTKILLNKHDCSNSMMKILKVALKSDKLTVFNTPPDTMEKYLEESSKWMFDKSYTKFHIIPTSARQYFAFALTSDNKFTPVILMDQFKDILPLSRTVFVPKCFEDITFGDAEDIEGIRGIVVSKNCHQNKFTYTVDAEHFFDVGYEAVIYDEIEDLPGMLDKELSDKIPVIGLMNDLSVICVPQDDEYEFVESWNGFWGKELAVSFDEKKPKYCDAAFLMLPEKPTFVVYDILKIMSMSPENIQVNRSWKFTITKDEEHPILIEFDNFDGTQKLATPEFLMALILKEHLKVIKNEIGKKPGVIGFCVFNEFNDAEWTRIEKGLKKSCKLLKIECIFVKADHHSSD